MKVTILKKDFDKAVKQDWSAGTCILSQAFRIRLKWSEDRQWPTKAMSRLMNPFDSNFRHVGDEKKPILQRLRAKLPITFEL